MPATPAWPPRSAPRLFVEQVLEDGAQVQIEGNQAHYLSRVMRVGPGDAVIVCDNVTGEWAARVVDSGKRHVVLELAEKLRERETVPDLWLCPALLKKDRFDQVLEKATELGVARIQPVLTSRCVADKLNPERAQTIATEAAEQCARTALPEVEMPVKLAALLRSWPDDRKLFFADELGGAPAASVFESPRRRGPQDESAELTDRGPRLGGDSPPAAILIGPEGGFTDEERAAITALPQAKPISLGPRILRGETASIAAVALWMGVAGDWAKRG